MIQLANDPNASKTSYPPEHSEAKGSDFGTKRSSRSGHAWPFLSKYAPRPAQQDNQKPTANDSGS